MNNSMQILTDDEILTATLYGQSEARMIRNGRAIESAVLSKLRAPVAGERAAFEKWTGYTEDALSRDAGDGYCIKGVDNQWRAWQASRAALASAPVAPQACPTDVCQAGQQDGVLCANNDCDRANGVRPPMCRIPGVREDVLRRAAERMTNAPVADERGLQAWADRFPEISDMGRLRDAWNAARASAPVAGEAVYTLSVKGVFHNWKPTTAAFSIPDGEHQLFLSPAAPQASALAAEYTRGRADGFDAGQSAALEKAAQVAYEALHPANPRSDWTEFAEHSAQHAAWAARSIRALKSQADKDGGQQRAGDGKEPR